MCSGNFCVCDVRIIYQEGDFPVSSGNFRVRYVRTMRESYILYVGKYWRGGNLANDAQFAKTISSSMPITIEGLLPKYFLPFASSIAICKSFNPPQFSYSGYWVWCQMYLIMWLCQKFVVNSISCLHQKMVLINYQMLFQLINDISQLIIIN